ncbi:virulence factor TspB C-terminal domain-related protein [Pseudomonas sp. 65/3-MNA-CIBAN-0223]|uniref:virulence factor TspB C-terminal domain-related protein n=2 Tax=unclassified Pseudomonas TaxID=196821 RepID=UPI00332080C4
MGSLFRIKAVVLFGCLFFASQSFAAIFVYHFGDVSGPDPSSVCPQRWVLFGDPLTYSGAVQKSYGGGYCVYDNHGSPYEAAIYTRTGDTCPAGSTYNEVTKLCSVLNTKKPGDKCDDQTGGSAGNPMIWDDTVNKCVRLSESQGDAPCTHIKNQGASGTAYTVAGNLDKGGNAVAPPTFAEGSLNCQMQTISSSECTINVPGAISCNVIGIFTGKANPTGSTNAADALCPEGGCPVKEPKTESKEEGCTPAGNGTGGTTCTQTKETTKEGTQQCGTVNGAYKCVTKPPYSNGVKTTITATSETLSDGSVKVTTVKDSSNTVCTDVKSCTTQTSTTVSHNTTKPSGGTSSGSSCTGSCTPNGGGVETNPNAGSGNSGNGSSGNGNGDGEGEGGDGTASTTDDCEAPPDCDGDPFQCAILKQAHIDTCKLMAGPTDQEQADSDAKTDAAYADLDAHQTELDGKVTGLLSQFQSSTSGGGSAGKCLPDYQFAVAGHSIDMEFSKACDSLSWVRLVVLAGAYLFAARIVSREV